MQHLRKYGFLAIFFALFVGSAVGYALEDRQHEEVQHQQLCEFLLAADPSAECPTFEYQDSSFWVAWWENWQSEWIQLFVQGLLLVALQQRLAKKDSENTKQDVKDALEEMKHGSGYNFHYTRTTTQGKESGSL